jgi:hypothetical protein
MEKYEYIGIWAEISELLYYAKEANNMRQPFEYESPFYQRSHRLFRDEMATQTNGA